MGNTKCQENFQQQRQESWGEIVSPLTLSLLNLSQEGHAEIMELDDF